MVQDALVKPQPGAKCLIVALTSYGGHMEPATGFEWQRILGNAPAHRIFLRDSMQHWYQGGLLAFSTCRDDTVEQLGHYIAANGIERVMVMGSSMGGYGALLLGGLLRAERVLAFAPQTTMDLGWMSERGDMRWEARTREMARLGLPGLDLARQFQDGHAAGRSSIFYCRDDLLDVAHAEHVRAFPGMDLQELDDGAHGVAYHMAKTGQITALISDYLGQPLNNDFEAGPHASSGGT